MTPAIRMPVSCLNACWLTPWVRGARACIDRLACCTRADNSRAAERDELAPSETKGIAMPSVLAAKNKCLAQTTKSRTGGEATKERETDWISDVPLNDLGN